MAVLEARGLNVRFGGHHAVRDVDLDVDAGEIVGLIGPNGAGKTTTFNAVSGVQKCTGTVSLGGVDISDAPPHKRARLGMSRTFQRIEVFGTMTAYDNIRTAAEIAARSRRDSMREAVQITDQVVDLVMELCSSIFVLNLGELIASGSAEQVRNDPAVQEAYLGAAV